ncbi:MAG TPA: MobF family relaxase [Solirubrobacterales bacterium]|nr:MobF family relaxase [Solirubrobacterales bacterium]
MVGVTKIQRGNAGYWLSAVAEGGDDYYTKPGEAPGEWVGELADELGLHGQIDPAGYGAILEGRDPTSGAQLLKRPETRFRLRPNGTEKRVEPVLGYDVRFSAPKSISLLYALGSKEAQERIVAVMNDAVKQGIAHLEKEACMVQRGAGGVHLEPGRGFVGMAFRHRMSRAGDPALHVHVVISNLTRAASDGKWLSLASPKGRSPLFPHGKSAGVVFQAALRAGILREFGLEFDAVRNGYADLKGFPRELIDAFSTRAREIADWMERNGVDSVKAAQTAAYRTRAAKDHDIDIDERRVEWEAQAEPFGFTPQSTEAMIASGAPRQPERIEDKALDAAVRQLELSTSHFDRRRLLWALADQLPEGADLHALSAGVNRILNSDRVLCIYEGSGPLDADAFTTPRIAEAEARLIDGALQGTGAGVAVVDRATVGSALARHDYLGPDQREMVIRLTSGGQQVATVAAWPGTGKTTALRASAEAWSEAGYPVIGCATARTATGELIDAGVRPSFSIRSLLHQAEVWKSEGRGLAEGTVIVVDEANVSNTFDLQQLHALTVECGGKLVLIGDPRQIGAIGPGGAYVHLTHLLDTVRLTTIRRQAREADQRIVSLVHEGRGSEALDLLRTEGKLVVGEDHISTLQGLLLDWHADYLTGADAVMIARRNRDVDYLNDQAHEVRRLEGRLGEAEVIVGERPIARGDRVQTRINSRAVDNRERWDVIDVDATARTVSLIRVGGDGRSVTLGPEYLDRATDHGTAALEYAYAVTKFGAESKTFDRAYPLLDRGSTLNEELVALSRGREVANVYTDASSELLDPDLGPGRREVTDPLQDVREAIERDGADFPAIEASVRAEIDSLPLVVLSDRHHRLAERSRGTDPILRKQDRLDRAIARDRDSLRTLAAEREAIERLSDPPATDIARLTAAEVSATERLQRNLAEREAMPGLAKPGQPTAPPTSHERLEVALIEQRFSRETSKRLAAARSDEVQIIYDVLGSYPTDPALAAHWDGAAHAVLSYRLRHNVRDEKSPLGREPSSASGRAEHARASSRLQAARRQLQLERVSAVERAAVRDLGLGR